MTLGEARSKVEHVAGSLLKPAVAEQLHLLFLAKGALATTAIEGNTLSEEQALQAVQGTLDLPPSQQYLQREIENVVRACNRVKDDLRAGAAARLSPAEIKEFNRLVLDGLDLDDDVVPGEVSRHSVVVANYRGAPREDCDYLLGQLCDWLNEDFVAPSEELRVPYAIIQAVVAHLYLAWIHAFGDGNGRTARLVELKLLLAAQMPMPATHLLSNHYNQTRGEYYRQLARSSASDDGVIAFLTYAATGFVDGLRNQLALIRSQQFDDRWEQFIYETFGGDTQSPPRQRQLRLVLDLSTSESPVPRSRLTTVSPEVAALYAGKTRKTLTRDINALTEMGLIELIPSGYQPARSQILAFLPLVPVSVEIE